MTNPLLTSLEQAGEGSRFLDAEVYAAVTTGDWTATRDGWIENPGRAMATTRVTTSLDAALALAERIHPGFHAALYTSDGDQSRQAMITVPTRKDGPFNATAATIPLALCIAILRATNQEQPNV